MRKINFENTGGTKVSQAAALEALSQISYENKIISEKIVFTDSEIFKRTIELAKSKCPIIRLYSASCISNWIRVLKNSSIYESQLRLIVIPALIRLLDEDDIVFKEESPIILGFYFFLSFFSLSFLPFLPLLLSIIINHMFSLTLFPSFLSYFYSPIPPSPFLFSPSRPAPLLHLSYSPILSSYSFFIFSSTLFRGFLREGGRRGGKGERRQYIYIF